MLGALVGYKFGLTATMFTKHLGLSNIFMYDAKCLKNVLTLLGMFYKKVS